MSMAAPAGMIDAASASALRRFMMRLCLLTLFDLLGGHDQLRTFIGMVDLAAIFTCACAIFSREPAGRGPLNQWDETLAFFGLRCAAAFVLGAGL